jgi:hypothetical protein
MEDLDAPEMHTDAPLPKLTRIRMAVLMLRLFRVAFLAIVSHFIFAIVCWFSGTSVKEVRRQMRLQELIGDRRPFS